MENVSDAKIWRYIDFAKLASLLISKSLYFACPSEFDDPYEGFAPKSHMKAYSEMMQPSVDRIVSIKNQLGAQEPAAEKTLDTALTKLAKDLSTGYRKATLMFGASCWHISEYESAAMWKLYSAPGPCIAIESTIGQLKLSLTTRTDLAIDRVRYMDFDNDPIEKGHKHYGLFLKRKSFEHEKELRAIIRLPEEGRGASVECNLDTLINRIHVSPLAPPYFKDAVKALCLGRVCGLQKPVLQSKLFNDPDYGIEINVNPK